MPSITSYKISRSPVVASIASPSETIIPEPASKQEPISFTQAEKPQWQKEIEKSIAFKRLEFIKECKDLLESDPEMARQKMENLFSELKIWSKEDQVVKTRVDLINNDKKYAREAGEIEELIKAFEDSCENYMKMLWEELPDSKANRAFSRKSSKEEAQKEAAQSQEADSQLRIQAAPPVIAPEASIKSEVNVDSSVIPTVEKPTDEVGSELVSVSNKSESQKMTAEENVLNRFKEICKTEQTYCESMAIFFREIKILADKKIVDPKLPSIFYSKEAKNKANKTIEAKKFAQDFLSNITEEQIKSLTTNPFSGIGENDLSADSMLKIMESNSFKDRLAIMDYLTVYQEQIVAKLGAEKLSYDEKLSANKRPTIDSLAIMSVQRCLRYTLLLGEAEAHAEKIKVKESSGLEGNGLCERLKKLISYFKDRALSFNKRIDFHKNMVSGKTDEVLKADFDKSSENYFKLQADPSVIDSRKQVEKEMRIKAIKRYCSEMDSRKKHGKNPVVVSDFLLPELNKTESQLPAKTDLVPTVANTLAFFDSNKVESQKPSIDLSPAQAG